jgi:hypothetical protein
MVFEEYWYYWNQMLKKGDLLLPDLSEEIREERLHGKP